MVVAPPEVLAGVLADAVGRDLRYLRPTTSINHLQRSRRTVGRHAEKKKGSRVGCLLGEGHVPSWAFPTYALTLPGWHTSWCNKKNTPPPGKSRRREFLEAGGARLCKMSSGGGGWAPTSPLLPLRKRLSHGSRDTEHVVTVGVVVLDVKPHSDSTWRCPHGGRGWASTAEGRGEDRQNEATHRWDHVAKIEPPLRLVSSLPLLIQITNNKTHYIYIIIVSRSNCELILIWYDMIRCPSSWPAQDSRPPPRTSLSCTRNKLTCR